MFCFILILIIEINFINSTMIIIILSFYFLSLRLLIFCMNDQDFVANLDYDHLCFFCNIVIVNHFSYCFIILRNRISFFCVLFLHLFFIHIFLLNLLLCVLLSLLGLNAILLTSSVNTLCFSLLNLCFRIFCETFCTNFIFF